MIQVIMLVGLGFLVASLLALLIAPAAWARAVRITSHRIRSSLPVNETEIRAEQDQLRARHAITVHQLGKKIEQAELSAARQRVELNRREARITELEQEANVIRADLDENKNARHVLAQTLNERLPRAEQRLNDARGLLTARDQQIIKFVSAATKQQTALAEAQSIALQQQNEIGRLKTALMARQNATRQRFEPNELEQTQALWTEVDELRARTASQAGLIDRLKATDARQEHAGVTAEAGGIERLRKTVTRQSDEIEELRTELKLREQSGETSETGKKSKLAPAGIGSKLSRIEAVLKREKETTDRLRVELASTNDRSARQIAQYREELRRVAGAIQIQSARTNSAAPTLPRTTAGDATSVAARAIGGLVAEKSPADGDAEASEQAGETPNTASRESHGRDVAASRHRRRPRKTSEDGVPAVTPSTPKSAKLLDRLKGYEKS